MLSDQRRIGWSVVERTTEIRTGVRRHFTAVGNADNNVVDVETFMVVAETAISVADVAIGLAVNRQIIHVPAGREVKTQLNV